LSLNFRGTGNEGKVSMLSNRPKNTPDKPPMLKLVRQSIANQSKMIVAGAHVADPDDRQPTVERQSVRAGHAQSGAQIVRPGRPRNYTFTPVIRA